MKYKTVGTQLRMAVATVVLILASLRVGAAAPDAHAAPRARIFASESGQVFLKIIPGKDNQPALGTLTALAANGTEEILWSKPMVRVPAKAYVSERTENGAYVVALDEKWEVGPFEGRERGIVIYDEQGSIVRDFGETPPLSLNGFGETTPGVVSPYGNRNTLLAEDARFKSEKDQMNWTLARVISFADNSPAQRHSIIFFRAITDLKTGTIKIERTSVRAGGFVFHAAPHPE
jgi:hypothetical protein